jgi:ACS family D-galactonate transporter-like MFS transporter
VKSSTTHDNANRKSLTIVGLLFAFSTLSYFDRTIMSIAGPSMMRDFHLSATEMGAIYSAFIFGYALLMIPGGDFTDRMGPRRTLAVMGWSVLLQLHHATFR